MQGGWPTARLRRPPLRYGSPALLAPRGGCGRSAWPLPRPRIDRPRRSAASGRLPPLRCGAQRRTRATGRPPCISLHHRALRRLHLLSLCLAPRRTPRCFYSPCGQALAVARVRRRGAQGTEGCAACGVPQILFEHRVWPWQGARWSSRASYLRAFRDRAPQGTRSEAKGGAVGPPPVPAHRGVRSKAGMSAFGPSPTERVRSSSARP
jgi:hypothetical protein